MPPASWPQARAAVDPRVRVLVHDGNRGYGAAVRTGIAAARLEWIFLTDADLQFDMAELARFVPLAQSSDIVAGFRTHRADPPHRLLNAAAWNVLVRRMFDVPLRDVDCAFKLMRRDLVQALALAAEGAMVEHRARRPRARRGRAHRRARRRTIARGWPGGRRGASPRVVLRAFRELRALRAELREGTPAGAPADLSLARAPARASASRPRAASRARAGAALGPRPPCWPWPRCCAWPRSAASRTNPYYDAAVRSMGTVVARPS